jgi:hypothetical protein
MKSTKVTVGLLLVAMLAAPAVGCGRNNDDNNAANNTANGTTPNNDTEVNNAIQADDQTLEDPTSVLIAKVVADVDSFVVIHADDGGSPGEVIGHVSVTAGETTDVEVSLEREAVDGETLYAMLHVDDPADGEYTFGDAEGEDAPALDADGAVVVDSFKVTIEGADITPSVDVLDQELTNPLEVNIASVTAAVDGYIVIHEADENGDLVVEPAIGFAAVSQGENTNVKVTLNRDAVDGETLFAMLHSEDSGNDTYDGPGADAPVMDADGNVITPDFTVTVPAEGPTPSVTVNDQTLSRDAADLVVISEVVAAADGYIVIHEADENGDLVVEPAIGFAAVTTGTNTDVEVTLTRDAVEGETLFAMLHTEDSGNDTYDGPGADAPVMDADGNIITPGFTVSFELLDGVTVNDQTADPANVVTIAQVDATAAGYIVIHEADADGNLVVEPAIGVAAVSVGGNTDVEVTLDRPVIDGETLFAMLHSEDNGNTTYDGPGVDAPVTNSNDEVITPAFTVGAGASVPFVTVQDQLADPANEVIVDQVLYDADGWIVIHEDNGNAPGAVIGKAALTAGVNSDITITLDRNVISGEKLYAMLHSDDGDGMYEFPGPDGPVMDANGDVITPSFIATTPENMVTAADQTVGDVSTIITVGSAYSLQAGHVAVYENDNGAAGALLGSVAITQGNNVDLDVELARPLADGEEVFVRLHGDDGNGTFDGAGTDAPAQDNSGNEVSDIAAITVPAGTPAVIFVMNANGTADYIFESVVPARFATEVSLGDNDPALTLRQDWRYTFDLSTNGLGIHPIQFGDTGGIAGVGADWKLAQGPNGDASREGDAGINWVDMGGNVSFTVTSVLAGEIPNYACVTHGGMEGTITVVTP